MIGGFFMPNIQPISVLHRGRFAVLKIDDYDRMRSSLELLSKLHEGEYSASKTGWLGIDEIKTDFGLVDA